MACSPSSYPTTFSDYYYVGINLEDIIYGIDILLYLQTMHIFLGRRRQRQNFDIVYAVFSTIMFLSATVFVAANALLGQRMWLATRNYPGGENVQMDGPPTMPYRLLASLGTFVLQQMTDALMIYRFRIMCDSHVYIIVPCILWLATFALGVTLCFASVAPGSNPYVGLEGRLGIAYYTISVFLNVTLTCIMCYGMVSHGKKVRKHLGAEFASPYFSIVMLLVESASPLALSGIAYLVAFGMGSPLEITFSRVYILMMCVSPQMLILRVAKGIAWHKDSFKLPESTIAFSPGDPSGSSYPTFLNGSRLDASGGVGNIGVPRTRGLAFSPG